MKQIVSEPKKTVYEFYGKHDTRVTIEKISSSMTFLDIEQNGCFIRIKLDTMETITLTKALEKHRPTIYD